MRIGGLQRTSGLDYPGLLSAVVFTAGCNFNCPYCHNADLARGRTRPLNDGAVLGFLVRRGRVLDGLVISGGEPTLQPDLPAFCAAAKALGYAVKLDTNGSRPDVLRRMLALRVLDYVALDVKADPRNYPPAISPGPAGDAVGDSIAALAQSGVPHEFRVTAVAPFIDARGFTAILGALDNAGGRAPLFLQKARLEKVLDPDFFTKKKGRALNAAELEELRGLAARRGRECAIR